MKKIRKHLIILGVLLILGISVLMLNASALSGNSHLFGSGTVNSKSSTSSTNSLPQKSGLGYIPPIAGGSIASGSMKKANNTKNMDPSDSSRAMSQSETSIQTGLLNNGSQDVQSIQPSAIAGTSNSLRPTQTKRPSNMKPNSKAKKVKQVPSPKEAKSIDIASVSLSRGELNLKKGETASLSATVSPSNTTQNKTVSWTSTNQRIAAVDGSGKVTAVGGGAATIIASTSNGKTATCTVTVTVPAISISLNLTDISLDKGDSRMITAMVNPADTTEKVVWSTSDGKVAVVDSTGNVTAQGPGTAVITATAGSIRATCNVSVGISISRVILSNRKITLKKGDSKTLTAWVDPPDTTEDTSITWLSSDSKIATVDKDGTVTAVEGDKVIITAQAGTHTAQCTVNVIVPVTGMKLSNTDVERGTTKTITPIFEPSDATDRAATWTSSDASVATVDAAGKVSGLKIGKTTITAVSHDGGFTAKCTVNVIVPVKEINLSKNNLTLKKGDTESITATILPDDTTEDRTVEWFSSNPDVAAVDNTGKITAVEGGNSTVTATVGNHKARCLVQVIVPLTGISLNTDTVRLPVNTDMTLSVIYSPADATDKAVTWKSSNSEIVTADTSGKLHGVTTGSAIITVTSHDGGYLAQCMVDVVIPVTGIRLDQSSMTLKKGETPKLTATISPANATDQSVEWTSSDSSVASVDDTGHITAVEGGSAIITVKAHDGGYTAQCRITVIVPVTGITLDKTSLSLAPGSTATLKGSLQPDDATDTGITWVSSAPNLISVDQNGTVKALVETGTATITATTHDGEFTANCDVTIQTAPGAVQNLSAKMVDNTNVKITWDAPAYSGTSKITKYQVTINGTEHSINVEKDNFMTISCPTDAPKLIVSVCAYNNSGSGTNYTVQYNIASHTSVEHNYRDRYLVSGYKYNSANYPKLTWDYFESWNSVPVGFDPLSNYRGSDYQSVSASYLGQEDNKISHTTFTITKIDG